MSRLATLLRGWHAMRIIRLALGLFLVVTFITQHDVFSGLFGALFLFQAVTNTGCCGNTCATDVRPKREPKPGEEIEFEEIKQ